MNTKNKTGDYRKAGDIRMYTPKQRMLNAYRGLPSDRTPVSPEFWYFYPAKVLGVPMIELEREIPFWQALKTTFEKYECEGFGIVFPEWENQNIERSVSMDGYTETTTYKYRGHRFEMQKMYDKVMPSWVVKRLADSTADLESVADMLLDTDNCWNYEGMQNAYTSVGESYLLEVWCGEPFFDFVAGILGFEPAVFLFADEDEENRLLALREKYTEYQLQFVRDMAANTPFESFMIGCNYSCNSLIGQNMWRQWDKPYLKAMVDEIHRQGKLLHIHFHGRSIQTIDDFAELGLDCVCPFERSPGGDVDTEEHLHYVREHLQEKVTFNGNVHTVETLIRGNPEDAIREVQQIKSVFSGSNRLIVGTGDQVGKETKEDNLLAMIEEAKRLVF